MSAAGETRKRRRRKAHFPTGSKRKKTNKQTAFGGGADGFWEIERVKAVCAVRGMTQFLVEWKGDYPDEWLPEESLCESALQEAHQLQDEESARKLGLVHDTEDELSSNGASLRNGTNMYMMWKSYQTVA